MKRRKFITSSMLAASAGTAFATPSEQQGQNEIYELKSYEMTFARDQSAWIAYQKGVLTPSLTKLGASAHLMYTEEGEAEPKKVWTLTAYPDMATFQKSIELADDPDFIAASADYAGKGQLYNRISSSLLYAFDGLKEMLAPIDDANLYELRIYEGANEDAVRRKVKMFNVEEIDLFYRTDLNPIFFGKMVTGPYEPCLVYMLNFRDMDHRAAAWKKFIEHPDWNEMRVKPEYANTVSNIRKIFLRPM